MKKNKNKDRFEIKRYNAILYLKYYKNKLNILKYK